MRRTAWWMLLVAAVFLASCETRTPEGIVPPDKMEDLLYDYHLAQSMARQAPDSTAYRYRLYTEAVYRKYGINAVQFDSTMAWYTRHSDRLYKIYERVNRRLVEDVGASGNGTLRSRYTSLSSTGDTANVWTGIPRCILTPMGGNNVFTFSMPADTSFHAGDRVMWHFYVDWICREGQRSAQAVLALTLDNDSVVITNQSIYGSGEQRITAPRADRSIKRVSGFVYVTDTWSASFKLMIVSDFSLVRMRVREPLPSSTPAQSADTLMRQSAGNERADSVRPSKSSDTLRHGRTMLNRRLMMPRQANRQRMTQ